MSRVLADVGLPITVGVARTRFLAKVASGAAKPNGLLVVEPDRELAFLHPLPVERLWGVGPKTAAKLHGCGMRVVADVAAAREPVLRALLGPAQGRLLFALAHNRDPRPVQSGRRRRSIGAQRALGSRPRPFAEDLSSLMALVDRVARRLRAATELLENQRAIVAQRGLTVIGVALTNLCDPVGVQLVLPLDRDGELDAAIDRVKDRFGTSALTRGSLIGQSPHDGVPVLRE